VRAGGIAIIATGVLSVAGGIALIVIGADEKPYFANPADGTAARGSGVRLGVTAGGATASW
jgi:hypothetical protein